MTFEDLSTTHWGRKVVKPGGGNRQTRKYFYGKKSYGALLKSDGAAPPLQPSTPLHQMCVLTHNYLLLIQVYS